MSINEAEVEKTLKENGLRVYAELYVKGILSEQTFLEIVEKFKKLPKKK